MELVKEGVWMEVICRVSMCFVKTARCPERKGSKTILLRSWPLLNLSSTERLCCNRPR